MSVFCFPPLNKSCVVAYHSDWFSGFLNSLRFLVWMFFLYFDNI